MEESTEIQKAPKGRKKILLLLIALLSVLMVFYILGAVYFTQNFYPNTFINGVEFSGEDSSAVAAGLTHQWEDYQLRVDGRDLKSFENREICILRPGDIQLTTSYNEADAELILKSQNAVLWPGCIWGRHDYSMEGQIGYDEEALRGFLGAQEEFQPSGMVEPRDAYIDRYSDEEQRFVMVPEIRGSKLDTAKAMEAVENAIARGDTFVSLEEAGCYAEPSVTSEDASLKENLSQANQWLETDITYDWNGAAVHLTGEQIKDWVAIADGRAVLDENKVRAFVKENAQTYDTYKKNRIFHTFLGYDLELPGGEFGWLTDQDGEVKELLALIDSGATVEREPEYASKGPWKGTNDIGNSYLEADLTHQHLYLFQEGQIVLESDFVSGDMSNGNATPQGVFGITYKTTNAVLRGADYVTPVNYWMPFHGNYGLHDATWRDAFGGDIYLANGSHGCLNLPLDKAGEIYQYMEQGFPVICYYYPPGILPEPEIPAEQEEPEE